MLISSFYQIAIIAILFSVSRLFSNPLRWRTDYTIIATYALAYIRFALLIDISIVYLQARCYNKQKQ